MSFEFAWPWALWLAPLPLLALLLPPASSVGAALRVPFMERLGAQLDQRQGNRARILRGLLLTSIWALLVASVARPIELGEPVAQPTSGRDVMLAVDLSGSMDTKDMQIRSQIVNRLTALKVIMGEFISRRQGDRVGLILFGRNAYLQSPLSFDIGTVRQLLEEAEIGLAGKETAIGDALGLAVKRLRDQPAEQRVLILVTDGANTAGSIEPLKAAELAEAAKVKIHTIGIGADRMVQRSLFGDRVVNPSAELDEPTLRKIAAQTGGEYFRARDTAEMNRVYTEIDRLEPIEQDDQALRPIIELYPYPLTVAILLACLALFAAMSSQRWGFAQ
ncbi:MAG: VWA domain-containing protein [Xanthomonadales bacterium]|nr:VWA domain-containing protein [Xanthomonadales bacterium]